MMNSTFGFCAACAPSNPKANSTAPSRMIRQVIARTSGFAHQNIAHGERAIGEAKAELRLHLRDLIVLECFLEFAELHRAALAFEFQFGVEPFAVLQDWRAGFGREQCGGLRLMSLLRPSKNGEPIRRDHNAEDVAFVVVEGEDERPAALRLDRELYRAIRECDVIPDDGPVLLVLDKKRIVLGTRGHAIGDLPGTARELSL